MKHPYKRSAQKVIKFEEVLNYSAGANTNEVNFDENTPLSPTEFKQQIIEQMSCRSSMYDKIILMQQTEPEQVLESPTKYSHDMRVNLF